MQKYFDTNKKYWNQAVDIHMQTELYNMEAFLKGTSSLMAIENDALGDVSGKSILHLQCHFGQDSLSWARKGAEVTAMDFSEKGIDTARKLNAQLGTDVKFICCNIYDLKNHLDKQFDIVFTSYGVLTWLPDLNKWADIVNHFLKPSGTFFISEFHPFLLTLEFETLEVKYPYFNHDIPYHDEGSGTYADRKANIRYEEYGWGHSLGDIIQPLLNQKLILEEFKEYSYSPYDCFPNMKKVGEKQYKMNGFQEDTPHIFSLKMKKPHI